MKSETVVQQQTMLKVAQIGQVWRNNVGACVDQSGRQIRYGLANTSAQMNKEIKSSDLICIIPVQITQEMVGKVIGVFTALECKHAGWTFPNPTNKAEYERASAQAKFHDIVRKAGGFAGFVSDPDQIYGVMQL